MVCRILMFIYVFFWAPGRSARLFQIEPGRHPFLHDPRAREPSHELAAETSLEKAPGASGWMALRPGWALPRGCEQGLHRIARVATPCARLLMALPTFIKLANAPGVGNTCRVGGQQTAWQSILANMYVSLAPARLCAQRPEARQHTHGQGLPQGQHVCVCVS